MRISLVLSAASLLAAPAFAQWDPLKTPNIPRTGNGKVDMTAPAPKAKDGKPDLSGIWQPPSVKYLINIAADLKADDVPMQPWAADLYKQRRATNGKDDPDAKCLPSSMPRKDGVSSPYKLIQLPDEVVFLYESRTTFRQIFLDGRPMPKDPQPAWDGYSTGHWDGDTLVVETTGFNDLSWLDSNGHPHTDALHLTERFHRRDFGHLEIQIAIDDPKAYTKPWSVTEVVNFLPDSELIEYICNENEKDLVHLVGK
jgi:hypothetical protein